MSFTSKQKEIVARKLGYDGPMQGFDEYLKSSPALEMRYGNLSDKYMAKGGMVKKYQEGGDVANDMALYNPAARIGSIGPSTGMSTGTMTGPDGVVYNADGSSATTKTKAANADISNLYQSVLGRQADPEGAAFWEKQFGETVDPTEEAAFRKAAAGELAAKTTTGTTGAVTGGGTPTLTDKGVPVAGKAASVTAQTTAITPQQLVADRQAGDVTKATATTAQDLATATTPVVAPVVKYEAGTSTPAIKEALEETKAAQGTVSQQAKVTAEQGQVSEGALAKTQKVGEEYIKPVTAEERVTKEGELITPVTEATAVKAVAKEIAAPSKVTAALGQVTSEQLVVAQQIAEKDMAQAQAITQAGLAPDAKMVAARLDAFSVDKGTLAEAVQGNVEAKATVQEQLTQLMNSFNDGATPAWAAGAIRAANAAMASRGLGNSSVAGAAIFQAAMESALPIAAQDAKTYADMGMQNLNNRQQVALANAAAQQGLSLQNLSNEQQSRLANATNSFALQSQNLSNMQQTMLANTQIRASLQGKNLDNRQQAAVVNAARYAEQANINLNNIQQAALHNSSMEVQVDIANLSSRTQIALANAQIESALQGKILDNKQQAAVLNSSRIAENNNLTFTAKQNTALYNSQIMKDIGVANLNAAQATVLANAATVASMDTANLNNRQLAAVANAKAFLDMDIKNLDNTQQTTLFKAQKMSESILSDTGMQNAAKQFNATSENQRNQFETTMTTQVSQFNAAQKNAMNTFNVDQTNSVAKFNAELVSQREQFNASQRLVIDQSNAQWRREVSTASTAATNAANYLNAQNLQQTTLAEYNNATQLYRDQVDNAFKSYESDQDRATTLAAATIAASATKTAASDKATADVWSAVGSFAATLIK